ncbi:MAG: hypothetical protein ACTTKH_00635 [Treponema sp.]
MKQRKWFRSSALLMGIAFLMLFGILACTNPNSETTGKEKFPVKFKVDPAGKATLMVKEGSVVVNSGDEVENGKK